MAWFSRFQNFAQLSKFRPTFKISPDFQNWPIFKMLTYFKNVDPFTKCWVHMVQVGQNLKHHQQHLLFKWLNTENQDKTQKTKHKAIQNIIKLVEATSIMSVWPRGINIGDRIKTAECTTGGDAKWRHYASRRKPQAQYYNTTSMYYYASKRKPADICHRHFHCDLSLLSQVLKILWLFQNFVTFGNNWRIISKHWLN